MAVTRKTLVMHGIVNFPYLKPWLGSAGKRGAVLVKQDAPDFKKVLSDGDRWLRSTGTSIVTMRGSGSGGSIREISNIPVTSQILERLDEST